MRGLQSCKNIKLKIKSGRICVSRVISVRNLQPFGRDFMRYCPVKFLNWKTGSELCCNVEGSPMQSVPQLGSHDQTEGTWSSPRGAKRQMEQIERGGRERDQIDVTKTLVKVIGGWWKIHCFFPPSHPCEVPLLRDTHSIWCWFHTFVVAF